MSSLLHGVNLPASNIRDMLEKNDIQRSGVRSWQQLFGNASLGSNVEADTLTSYYSDAMSQAYTNNFEQRNAIMGSGLSKGSTQRYMGMNTQDLVNTYNKFIGNYETDMSNVTAKYGEEVGAINADLTKRATNFSNLFNSAYDYLGSELYGASKEAQGEIEATDYLKERGLEWVLDEQGGLKDFDSLGIFDNNQLTDVGINFFREVYNAQPQTFDKEDGTKARSFDKWLSDTNPELRDWWAGTDEFNYNKAGSNKGTANLMLGRDASDDASDVPAMKISTASYGDIKQSVETAVTDTLENKGRDGIKSISDIGTRVKKATSGINKEMTYDEWFKWGQKIADRDAWYDSVTTEGKALKMQEFVSSYVDDFKKYSEKELTTLKSTLNEKLGEGYASEFWETYGKDIDKLYLEIQAYELPEGFNMVGGSGLGDASLEFVKSNFKVATTLRDKGFQQKMTRLYADLDTFIKTKQKK